MTSSSDYLTVQLFYDKLSACDPDATLDLRAYARNMRYATGVCFHTDTLPGDWNVIDLSRVDPLGRSTVSQTLQELKPLLATHGHLPVTFNLDVLSVKDFSLKSAVTTCYTRARDVRNTPFNPEYDLPDKQDSLRMLLAFLEAMKPSAELLEVWYKEKIKRDHGLELFVVGDRHYSQAQLFARFTVLANDENWKDLFSKRRDTAPVSFYDCLFSEAEMTEHFQTASPVAKFLASKTK